MKPRAASGSWTTDETTREQVRVSACRDLQAQATSCGTASIRTAQTEWTLVSDALPPVLRVIPGVTSWAY